MTQGRTAKWRACSALALAALLAAGLATVAPVVPAAADGNEAPGAPFAARSITAGGSHTCAILPSGALKCWGNNANGQLGQDSTANLGDSAGEMAALPPVDLGAGRTATAVTAGESHTCALLDNGTVKCWGFGPWGQLGQGFANLGDQPGEMAALAPVNLGAGRTATAITAGANHTCALLDNGTVKCWGQADSGQLGQDSTSNVGQTAGSVAALPAVNLGAGRTATAVSAGANHTCARLDNGTVKCWGLNSSGQLGQGSTKTADETSVVVGDSVHLHVKLTNTGNVALHAVTIADPDAPGCEVAPFDLGVGLDSTVDCTHVATAAEIPTYSNTVSVTSAEITTPVVSDPVEVTVTLPAGAGLVSGTVTETGGAAPIGGAVVAVLDTATYAPVAVVTADGAGVYAAAPPAGTYFVYVIDPSQGHVSGYHGAPAGVVVTDGDTTTADVDLTPTRGTIAGTVTDTGGPVAGVLAMSVDLASGQPGAGDLTDNSGAYAITGLPAGPRLLELVDLSATHDVEFYDDVPTPAGAQVLDIVGAGTTTADAELATMAGPGAAAHLTGHVTATVGGNLEGVAVLAVRTSDFGLAAAGVTDASGNYDVALDAGDYKLAFYDPSGTHLFEWHDDQPSSGLGSAATVTAVDGVPAVTDAALTPTTGVVSGTVTDATTSDRLADVFVAAIATNGAVVGGTTTAVDGTYTLSGLPAGDIRIRFVDLTAAHTDEYHDNSPDYAGASLVQVAAGSATAAVDAALTLVP